MTHVFSDATLFDGLIFDVALIYGFMSTLGSFFDVFTADDLIANLGPLDELAPQVPTTSPPLPIADI